MAYVVLSVRILISLVFAVAAIAKAADLGGFARSVQQLVPGFRGGARAAAYAVVGAESAIAAGLAIPDVGCTDDVALGCALALDTAFCFVLIRALRRDAAPAACRCFGQWSADSLSPVQLGRNAVIAGACALGLIASAAAPTTLHAQGVMIAGFCGVVGAVLVIAFEDLAALVRIPPTARGTLEHV
ncbi:MauE/DoxX family redox-associated membrane protein [Actinospica robiniae]|uniref:MauE/DoxX family redox-associated membrane protein n=1 Tax=Actinospica robiniae TaxID=304901 RepID=UPI000400244A|nr:MauE/DoxX family redox-associated membrane protein [Actinospica robiniae]